MLVDSGTGGIGMDGVSSDYEFPNARRRRQLCTLLLHYVDLRAQRLAYNQGGIVDTAMTKNEKQSRIVRDFLCEHGHPD